MKTLSTNYKIWFLIGAGLFTIYQLVTMKPEQKMFDESDNYQ